MGCATPRSSRFTKARRKFKSSLLAASISKTISKVEVYIYYWQFYCYYYSICVLFFCQGSFSLSSVVYHTEYFYTLMWIPEIRYIIPRINQSTQVTAILSIINFCSCNLEQRACLDE